MVAQSEMMIEHVVRQADGSWLLREIGIENKIVPLPSLGIELNLGDIYENIEISG